MLMFNDIAWPAVANILLIDLLLSGDNALVIALAVKNLPADLKYKAAVIGASGAVILRVLFTGLVAFILKWPYLQAIGSILLLYIAWQLLSGDGDEASNGDDDNPATQHQFMTAVRLIISADVVMSLDNILAVGGASHGNYGLLLLGLGLSIPIVLFASTGISQLMNKYPVLVLLGSGFLAFTAADMFLHDPAVHPIVAPLVGPLTTLICLVVGIGLVGIYKLIQRSKSHG
jgi:YjbE family integral membrane protein